MTVQNTVGTGNETAGQTPQQEVAAPAQSDAEQAAIQQSEQQVPEKDPINDVLPTDEQPEQAEASDAEDEEQGEQPDGETFEIDLPKGYDKEDKALAGFMEVVKETGIKKEQAQKLFDMHEAARKDMMTAVNDAMKQGMERINADWQKECKTDKEFGGERFEASRTYVTAAIRRFVPESEQKDFIEFYKQANLQNCPYMFRMLARIGQATSEAGPINSDASDAGQPAMSIADSLYKNMNLK